MRNNPRLGLPLVLNSKQLVFAQLFCEYRATKTLEQIAIEAGYEASSASRLMKMEQVKAYIQANLTAKVPNRVLTKADRLVFWSQMTLDEEQPGAVRLRASELLGKAAGDFDAEAIKARAKTATDSQLRKYVYNRLVKQGEDVAIDKAAALAEKASDSARLPIVSDGTPTAAPDGVPHGFSGPSVKKVEIGTDTEGSKSPEADKGIDTELPEPDLMSAEGRGMVAEEYDAAMVGGDEDVDD
jgi:hypothetical protein